MAYRLLGSAEDAEEVVQEAQLRRHAAGSTVTNESAWLMRTVTNLAIDRLRRRRTERDAYPGPWLPEPPDPDWLGPESTAQLAEELSLGFMLLLERLSAEERAVFVLRQGFDLAHSDIAGLLEISEASSRQRLRRARARLEDADPSAPGGDADAEQQRLIEAMMLAIAADDVSALTRLFRDDAAVISDGGGVVSAARIPIESPPRIAQVMLHLARKELTGSDMQVAMLRIAGTRSVLLHTAAELHSLMQLEVREGKVWRLYILRNPAKLTRVSRWLDAADGQRL